VGDTQTNELFVGNSFRTKRHPVGSFKLYVFPWVDRRIRLDFLWVDRRIRSHAMNGGSGGEAVGSMEDGIDEMWEKFFALPDMDQDRNAEWSKGPNTALGGAGSKRQRTDAGDSNDIGDGEDAMYRID